MSKYDWGTFGLHIPKIMLPAKGTDYSKWAVVACDQFTSEPEYWDEVNSIVGDAPSTLRLMLPELYLGKPEEADMIVSIRDTMKNYLDNGVLQELPAGCILVKRTVGGFERLGLVIATDLEAYDYSQDSQSLTRATERTVVERIPPRLRIREGAPIEMPHIMILIDDPDKTVIEPLADLAGETVYDADLMMNGGHVSGTFLAEEQLEGMKDALSALYDKAVEKYGEGHVIFQAMGDGNHSLATAKANWEKVKQTLTPEEQENHPARFALCEIDYIHGTSVVESLSAREGNAGFLLPAMDKSMLFPAVAADGALPRKTFSIGEANEKRYYIESRLIG